MIELNTGKLRKLFPIGFKNLCRILTTSGLAMGRFLPDLQIFKVSEKDRGKKQKKLRGNKDNPKGRKNSF